MSRLLLAVSLVLLNGCAVISTASRAERKLSRLDIGMTRSEVKSIIGDPDVVRVADTRNDKSLRVDEFLLYPPYQPALQFGFGIITLGIGWAFPMRNHSTSYWLQYVDGKLEKWGRAGDLQPTVTGELTIRNE